MPTDATCNCGAIRVSIDDDELFTRPRGHVCHCFNCRKTSGSAFATNLMIEESKVSITGAENLNLYNDPHSLSGNIVKRYFCKTCGNPIKSETKPASDAGKVILKLGIFEKIPKPEWESFCKDRHEWVLKHDWATQYKDKSMGSKMEEELMDD